MAGTALAGCTAIVRMNLPQYPARLPRHMITRPSNSYSTLLDQYFLVDDNVLGRRSRVAGKLFLLNNSKNGFTLPIAIQDPINTCS